ncbi:CRTAM protein, partial [Molothrus ater]|nr:CRTAM protein [Molothrus ater]
LAGDTRHQLGADGKKWSSRSTLRILSYSPGVTATCLVQHPALGPQRLGASFPFQDLPSSDDPGASSPSASPENPEFSSPSASPENPEFSSPSASPENPEFSSPSASPKDPGVSSPSASPGVPAEKNLLLPILVAALILVLLIIVLLFMVKLKKAHGVWKRENDVSEQTLESYKSRSNEDSPGHEKNGQ